MDRRGGFTYIGLMVSVAVIGITTAVVGMSLKTASRIEKEKELIWIGHQFRNAIESYYKYRLTKTGRPDYPTDLKDLLKDPIAPGTLRHLRKIYPDPMTGKADWVIVQGPNGHIMGVHSNSGKETLKRDNFDLEDFKLKGKTKYNEWVFDYDPNAIAQYTGVPAPGSTQPGAAGPGTRPGAPPGSGPGIGPGTTPRGPATNPPGGLH